MITDFMGHGVFLVFRGTTISGPQPSCRVLGPYRLVRVGMKGIHALPMEGLVTEPLRIATRSIDDTSWELDGLGEGEPAWMSYDVVAPAKPTTCAEIQAANDWIRPDRP